MRRGDNKCCVLTKKQKQVAMCVRAVYCLCMNASVHRLRMCLRTCASSASSVLMSHDWRASAMLPKNRRVGYLLSQVLSAA